MRVILAVVIGVIGGAVFYALVWLIYWLNAAHIRDQISQQITPSFSDQRLVDFATFQPWTFVFMIFLFVLIAFNAWPYLKDLDK